MAFNHPKAEVGRIKRSESGIQKNTTCNHPKAEVGRIKRSESGISNDCLVNNRLLSAQPLPGLINNTIQILDTKKFKRYYEYALNGNLTRRDKVDLDTNITTDRWDYTYDNHQAGAIENPSTGYFNSYIKQEKICPLFQVGRIKRSESGI